MKKLIIVSLAFLAGLFVSCGKEGMEIQEPETDNGGVELSLSRSGEFTKSDDVDVKEFFVKLYKDGEAVKSYAKYSDVPTTIEVEPGTYSIEAGSAGQEKAAFSQPIFYGKKDFTVEAGKVASVSLVCELKNVKVTINYTERFAKEIADDFEVVVSNDTDANLIFDKTIIDNGISGYFEVSPLTITLQAKKVKTSEEVTHTIKISEVAAKDHFVITLDAQETGEIVIPDSTTEGEGGITISWEVNERAENIVVPGEDETPVDEGPSITGSGISETLEATTADLENSSFSANVEVKTFSDKKIAQLKLAFSSSVAGLGSGVDLANPTSDQAAALATMGIASVGTADTYTLPLVGLLKTMGVGNHTITITVTDSGEGENQKSTTKNSNIVITESQAEVEDEYLPQVTGDGIGTPITLSKSLTEEELANFNVDINIKTQNEKTIKDIFVTIESNPTDLQDAAAGMGLTGTFSIVDFSDAEGEARKGILMELGLISDPAESPILGLKSYDFKIGGFMSALALVAPEGYCKFTVKVVDSQDKEASAVCVVNVVE